MTGANLHALFARGQMRWKGRAARIYSIETFVRGLLGTGNSALCGERPGTLSLDPATFEKVDETFIFRFALSCPTLDSHC